MVHAITNSVAARAALQADVDERPFAVAVVLDGLHAGALMTVTPDGTVGSLGAELLDRNVAREAAGLLSQGRSTIRHFGPSGATLGEDVRVHIAAHSAPPRLVLIGAVDFAAALCPLAAGIGYQIHLCDPRPPFLSSPRFAGAERQQGWPQDVIPELDLGPRDVVVVFSHDPKIDVPALMAAFEEDVGYIGALGSRRTTRDRERRLREAGATDADIARLHVPCGLDIGAATAEETALSILAEIVATRRSRRSHALREAKGPIRSPNP